MKYLPLVFLFFLYCCMPKILESKVKELKVISVPNKDYRIRIVQIPSNATIQSSIQIRKFYENKKEEDVLQDYERYNLFDTAYFMNDSILVMVMRDTSSYWGNKPDTMVLTMQ